MPDSKSSENQNENQEGVERVSVCRPLSLKRKRPPTIQIPNVLQEISVDKRGSSPLKDADFCATGYGVGVFSQKGKKKFMEDAHRMVSCSNDKRGFFGVYDGHGGRKAVEFVAENLHSNILETIKNSSGNAPMQELIRDGYLKTDRDFLSQGLGSGACCVTALIEGKEIIVSNLGDCRAVLCRKGGSVEALTEDHKAGQEGERNRIEDKGGFVQHHRGAWRVHGILAVSRSIGDAHLKDWVVGEPDTKIIPLTKDMEFLVLASDGLWEEVGNQEVAEIVRRSCSEPDEHGMVSKSPSPKLRRVSLVRSKRTTDENSSPPPSKTRRIGGTDSKLILKTRYSDQENSKTIYSDQESSKLAGACKELVNLAVSRGSLDDITVMIVDLSLFRD